MINTVLKKVFGSKADRDMKAMRPLVDKINAREVEFQDLSDELLKAKTAEFRARLEAGETLDDLLVDAFATVKNACRRLLGTTVHVSGRDLIWDMVPFDVQLNRRDFAASGKDCRDDDRGRKDSGCHDAGLFECAVRQGRACGDDQ